MSADEQTELPTPTANVMVTIEIHAGEHQVKVSTAPIVPATSKPAGFMSITVNPFESDVRQVSMTAMRAALDAMYGDVR